jgi:hypothetical protein
MKAKQLMLLGSTGGKLQISPLVSMTTEFVSLTIGFASSHIHE